MLLICTQYIGISTYFTYMIGMQKLGVSAQITLVQKTVLFLVSVYDKQVL